MFRTTFIIVVAFLLACSPEREKSVADKQVSNLQVHRFAFEAFWPRLTVQQAQERARTVASVLTGTTLSKEAFSNLGTTEKEYDDFWLESADGIVARFHPNHNDMLLFNESVVDDIGDTDIGEIRAREVFLEAFSTLASAGVIAGEHFNVDAPSVSYTEMGIGDNESVLDVITTEYIFSLLRNINGVSFANAGIKISVHRSGMLAWIRTGGAEIRSEMRNAVEVPIGEGYEF